MGPGQFRITAESGDATLSQEVDIIIEEDARLSIIIPTSAPTETVTPQPTPTETPKPTVTPQPQLPTSTPPSPESPTEPGLLIGLSKLRALAGVIMGVAAIIVMALVVSRGLHGSSVHRLGRVLWGVTGGLLLYNYYALSMPGSQVFSPLGNMSGVLLILIGGIVGLALYRPTRRV